MSTHPEPSPSPSPTPGLTPQPKAPGESGSPEPRPTPSPSPGPDPDPVPWGYKPDVGVSSSWLRGRATDSDQAADQVRKTVKTAQDACRDLRGAAPGWEFVDSVDELKGRWETLNQLVRGGLETGAANFRASADAFDMNEKERERQFGHLPHD